MNDPAAFAMAFLSSSAPVKSNTELETRVKTEPDTQPWFYREHTHTHTDAYPSLPADTAQYSQLSTGTSPAGAGAGGVRPPPLNLEHSHTQRLNALATGPVTPRTPYLPFADLTLQTAGILGQPTVNSSPLSQPLSGYSSFSSLVSSGTVSPSIVSPTLSSPSSYGAAGDVFDVSRFSPALSSTLSPQLAVGGELSVTDLGLAPEEQPCLPDDMMDICKVEPDADPADPRVGPVVVNTVPSAPVQSSPFFVNPSALASMPSTPTMPPAPLYPPPLRPHRHARGDDLRSGAPPMHPPPHPKPKKFKYAFKPQPARAVSPDDLSHLEIPSHIRDAYGSRRRNWSTSSAATPRRMRTPEDPTPPASPPAPYLRRKPSEPAQDEDEGEDAGEGESEADELLSDSQTARSPSAARATPELRSVSSLSDCSPPASKRKAPDGRPRAGEKRMSQNRTAQKKYRDKNRRLAELRAEFNITALVLVEKVARGEITERKAFSQLAGHSRVFKHHMKNTCGTTFERLMVSVEEALHDER